MSTRQEIIKRHRESAGGDDRLGSDVGIENEDRGVKTQKPSRHAAADATPAQDADRFAGQLLADRATPGAFPHGAIALRDAAQAGQHEGDCHIGDRGIIASRRIRYGNAVGRGGIKIDVVDADPVHGDDTQPGSGSKMDG